MIRLSTFLLIFCGTLAGLYGQSKVQLSLPDLVFPGGDATICAPVVADSFPNLAGIQFSVSWDATQLNFVEVRYGANPLALNDGRTGMPEPDNFGVSFTTDDLSGITLDPGTTILELCFTAANASGQSPLRYTGYLIPEFIQEGQIVPFPFDTLPGSITYGPDAAVTVLPGDTNQDDQVDHTDLLNIGLLHGTSGPARTDDGSSFSPAFATPWPTILASGVNGAAVDANGDGTVTDEDLDVVDAFYGQSRDGLWSGNSPEGSSSGRAAVPGLQISGGPLRAGQSSELIVSLGDGADPDASGYGLAFTLGFNSAEIAANSISVDFSNSYLGDDLLTIAKVSPVADGQLEIALSRKDQVNTTAPGGEVCRITLTANENTAGTDYQTEISLTPDAFLLADQSAAAINGGTANVGVTSTVAVREPAWGKELRLYPNPYTTGPLYLGGNLPQLNRVKVLDARGRLLLEFPGNQREINLGALPAGSYLLQVESLSNKVNRLIVKR